MSLRSTDLISLTSDTSTLNQSVSHSYSSIHHHNPHYHGANAWWSVKDFGHSGITHQSIGRSLAVNNEEETWDLSDSLADLYKEVTRDPNSTEEEEQSHGDAKFDFHRWIEQDTNHGFIRVYFSDVDNSHRKFPCTLTTTAQRICLQCSIPPNSLHIQLNGDIIKRLDPFDCPLIIQNEYLRSIGYTDIRRIQEAGNSSDLSYHVKFYSGKPISDSTYSRNQLQAWLLVRKGKVIHQWVRRLCVVTGTRLLIYRDKNKTSKPTTVQLAKGTVEEVQFKGHEFCLKLTSSQQGDRSVYFSFSSESEYNKWLIKLKKGTTKLPTKADLSNCHLEFLPETVFINDGLKVLNLRHNTLKERPIEEDIYTIGWLDDLPRFEHLSSLNLADNELGSFPLALCKLRTLEELNLATNKISEIPPEISELTCLQVLHVHNNHLANLPVTMATMNRLSAVVIAFNHFTSIPNVLLKSTDSLLQTDSLIMAGNLIEKLTNDVLSLMKKIRKIDLRLNKLIFSPSETAKFQSLEHVTHVDIRDNQIQDLDLRCLKSLEYLNCERNQIKFLQISGSSIKRLHAAGNELENIAVSIKPEWLTTLDLSRNRMRDVPQWISDCFFLINLNVSHNKITKLPEKLFVDAHKLQVVFAGNNRIIALPEEFVDGIIVEELHLESNELCELPKNIFIKCNRLRYLNLTNNRLESLPEPNDNVSLNKLQELYLSFNKINNDCIPVISNFTRLKTLHLSHNKISMLLDKDVSRLAMLQELNISSNKLRYLPLCLGRHPRLQVLKANSNLLKTLPDLRNSPLLKILDVGSNRLVDVSMTNLMASQVNLLDISGNPNISVNSKELEGLRMNKKVCLIDMRGQNRSLLDLRTAHLDNTELPWYSGFAQTSGIRNKLSVSVINTPQYKERPEGLFCVIDGGRNDEVPKILTKKLPSIIEDEKNHSLTRERYLKYSLLSAHRKLKNVGQKLGASVGVCHIIRSEDGDVVLNVANTGDVEVVLCRHGKAERLSRLFTVLKDKEETQRVYKSDGIITEDGKINGVTQKTRLIGCGYLFPQLIPDAHTSTLSLHQEDQLIIMGNQGLWEFVSYQEAIDHVIDIPDPVVAAKRLQDLAQGYGSTENIGILVIRLLLTKHERDRMKSIVKTQLDLEQNALMFLESVPLSSENLYGSDVNFTDSLARKVVDGRKRVKHHCKDVTIKPLPNQRYRKKEALSEWDNILQKRLVDEVKFRELFSTFSESDVEVEVGSEQDLPSNWSTLERKTETYNSGADITIQPAPGYPTTAQPPPPPVWDEPAMYDSVEDFKRNRHLYPRNIDRDAVLFYQMQQARRAQNNSTSLSSIQSDPMGPTSFKYPPTALKSGSHSIEVLIRSPSLHGKGRQDTPRTKTVTASSKEGDNVESDNLRETEEQKIDFIPIGTSSVKECNQKEMDSNDHKNGITKYPGTDEETDVCQTPASEYHDCEKGDKYVEEVQILVEENDTDTSIDSKTSVETVRRLSPVVTEVTSESEPSFSEEAPDHKNALSSSVNPTKSELDEPLSENYLVPTILETVNTEGQENSTSSTEDPMFMYTDSNNHYMTIEVIENQMDTEMDTGRGKINDEIIFSEDDKSHEFKTTDDDEGPYATVSLVDGIITAVSRDKNVDEPPTVIHNSETHQFNREFASNVVPGTSSPQNHSVLSSHLGSNGSKLATTLLTDKEENNKDKGENDYTSSTVIKSSKSKQAPTPERHVHIETTEDKHETSCGNPIKPNHVITGSVDQSYNKYDFSVESKSGKKKPAPEPPFHQLEIRLQSESIPTPPACRPKDMDYLHCVQSTSVPTPPACRPKDVDYLHCVQVSERGDNTKSDSGKHGIKTKIKSLEKNKPSSVHNSPLKRYKQKPREYKLSKKNNGSPRQHTKNESANGPTKQQTGDKDTNLSLTTSQNITPDDFFMKEKYFHYTNNANVVPPTNKSLVVDNNVAVQSVQRPLSPDSCKEIFPWNEHKNDHVIQRPEKRTLFGEADDHCNSLTSSTDLLANIVDLDDVTEHKDKQSDEDVAANIAFL